MLRGNLACDLAFVRLFPAELNFSDAPIEFIKP